MQGIGRILGRRLLPGLFLPFERSHLYGKRTEAAVTLSTQANRVPVLDGHPVCLSLGFEKAPSEVEALAALENFELPGHLHDLPSMPDRPIILSFEPDRPQPRRNRDAQKGMIVSVGRVRECPLLGIRLVSVSHNTLRDAASWSLLNAELLVAQGYADNG